MNKAEFLQTVPADNTEFAAQIIAQSFTAKELKELNKGLAKLSKCLQYKSYLHEMPFNEAAQAVKLITELK